MAEDPKWDLAILASVQGFYEKLLQESLEGEVPVPRVLEDVSLHGEQVGETLVCMRRWLLLLDMAITPAMLRRAFTDETDPEVAEAMLRYFVRKKAHTDSDRDKTDMVATFLYRHPRVPGQWEQRGYGLDGSLPLSPFEIALLEILSDSDLSSVPEEHLHLLRRFDGLEEQVVGYRDFHALLGSGIIQTVRELKQSFEDSFFHPAVLAAVARFNATFGARFDKLFRAAAGEIKTFARDLGEQGAVVLGSVDGVDVTVDQVKAFDENRLLELDYGRALEKFHRVSKLKQALDERPPHRSRHEPPAAAGKKAVEPAGGLPLKPRVFNPKDVQKAITPRQLAAEEAKLLNVEQSVCMFVRVADPKFRQVVPMRFFNLTLTPAEAEACRSDYLEEKTLRAGVARVLLRLVAVTARIISELEELKRAGNSPSLWDLHAELLLVLLAVGRKTEQSAERVSKLAAGGGQQQLLEDLQTSVKKLQDYAGIAKRMLTGSLEAKSVTAGVS